MSCRNLSGLLYKFLQYAIGGIYKEDLKDYDNSIKAYEDLTKRYQQFPLEPSTFYALYLLYGKQGLGMQTENYKQQILKNYPNSEFAKLLQNPNYLAEKKAGESQVETYYKTAYSLYEAEQYPDVIVKTKSADTIFKVNPIAAKFDLLESFAIAHTQPVDTFKTALKNIIKKYVVGEEVDKAKQLLGAMDKPKGGDKNPKLPKDSTQTNSGSSIYSLHKTNPHYFVLVLSGDDPSIKGIQDSLSNFVSANYASTNYKVSTMMLDTKKQVQMLLVKQMKNMDEAMNFYADASSQTFYDNIENVDFYFFVIDDKNFATFFKNKNITDYMQFFDANYNP